MPTINITELTITRAQLADLFAEAERRIRAGEDSAPPLVDLLTLPQAGVVHADYLIELACQQAVIGYFDEHAFSLGHASGQPDTGPALVAELKGRAAAAPALPSFGLSPLEAAELQGFTEEQLRFASARIETERARRREAKLRGEAA